MNDTFPKKVSQKILFFFVKIEKIKKRIFSE